MSPRVGIGVPRGARLGRARRLWHLFRPICAGQSESGNPEERHQRIRTGIDGDAAAAAFRPLRGSLVPAPSIALDPRGWPHPTASRASFARGAPDRARSDGHGLLSFRARREALPDAEYQLLPPGPVFGPADPQFNDIYQLEDSASSTYKGVSFTLNRRMSNELEFSASYTLSKTYDNASDYQRAAAESFQSGGGVGALAPGSAPSPRIQRAMGAAHRRRGETGKPRGAAG